MKKSFSKTIFGKVITITFLTFVFSFIITGFLITSFFGNYAKDERAKSLKNIAPQIAELTHSLYIDSPEHIIQGDENYKMAYSAILESLSSVSESDIIITTRTGEIFHATKHVNLNGRRIIPRSDIKNSLRGGIFQTTGTLDSIFSEKRLIVTYPIHDKDDVYGVVILATAMPDITRNKIAIARLFLVIGTLVFLVALSFIFIISQRMTKPLKQLNRAAREIAKGNFDTRVKISGTDEISELGQTFNYMAASLKEIDDTQKSFIANVSHELRTPMTSISGFLEKIIDGTVDDPKKQKEYLEIAYNESQRLKRLVSDMLDISKMSLGQYNITKSTFDIAELLRLSVIKMSDALDEKFLDVNIDFEADKINVFADRDAISRVVTNILDNAIKFSDLNSVIDIRVKKTGQKAFVAISNDGLGIEPNDINHVFERFYKTDKSRNNQKGTGLGLHIVKNILALHDETIAVKSVNLTGTEYEFSENHPKRRTTFVFSLSLMI